MFNYFVSLEKVIQYNLFPQNQTIAIVIFAVAIVYSIKSDQQFKFLFFLLVSHLLIFLVSPVTLTFISVGMLIPILGIVVLGLKFMPKTLAGLFIVLIFGANLLADLTPHQSIFKVQPGMNLKTSRQVVKRTYEIAAGKKFSINTLTNPYLYPTLWAFLYQEHGNVPDYRGITTYSFAGKNVLPQDSSSRLYEFSIIEPDLDLPVKEITNERRLVSIEKIGDFILQTFVALPENNK